MKKHVVLAAILLAGGAAMAEDRPPFTVGECLALARGIKALDYAGAQIDPAGTIAPAPPGAKQYKLGALRVTLALNLAQLQRVGDAVEKARGELVKEVFGDKGAQGGPEMARFLAEFQKVLDKPCDVTPGRIKEADLRIGDGDGENQIPLSVIAALTPILERGK